MPPRNREEFLERHDSRVTPSVVEAAAIDRLFHAQCSLADERRHAHAQVQVGSPEDGQIIPLDAAFPARV
jgi:hypothetical protein